MFLDPLAIGPSDLSSTFGVLGPAGILRARRLQDHWAALGLLLLLLGRLLLLLLCRLLLLLLDSPPLLLPGRLLLLLVGRLLLAVTATPRHAATATPRQATEQKDAWNIGSCTPGTFGSMGPLAHEIYPCGQHVNQLGTAWVFWKSSIRHEAGLVYVCLCFLLTINAPPRTSS